MQNLGWTDERVKTLESMWAKGHAASQIAKSLSVTRNAVLGKAHRLGLGSRSVFQKRILELELGMRAINLLERNDILYVGDLVQLSEPELLRLPNFGPKVLELITSVLDENGLYLGMQTPDWPLVKDDEIALKEASAKVANLSQTAKGATFQPENGHFVVENYEARSDAEVAEQVFVQQMHGVLVTKSRDFQEIANRLDNQTVWKGIGQATSRLTELLDRPSDEVPSVLGYLYPIGLELGSFIELNQQLLVGQASYTSALDPEVSRSLSDLVRNLAPWLRGFPSVRTADDEASQFLLRASDVASTFKVIAAAAQTELLAKADLEMFQILRNLTERGLFQGEKAARHTRNSASNLVVSVASYLGVIYLGAVGSVVAIDSPLAMKAGRFLVSAEKSIVETLIDLPFDLRHAIGEFISELEDVTVTVPQPSKETMKDTD